MDGLVWSIQVDDMSFAHRQMVIIDMETIAMIGLGQVWFGTPSSRCAVRQFKPVAGAALPLF
jgi:hypothetical protein